METDSESQFESTNSKNNCQTLITICGVFVLCLENLRKRNSYFTALFSLLVSTLQSPKILAKGEKYLIHSYPTKTRQGVLPLFTA